MNLYEILDTKIDIEYESNIKTFYTKSVINDSEYEVQCEHINISTEQYNRLKTNGLTINDSDTIWYIAFTGPNFYKLTNANIPLKVFSFVKQSLLKFIKIYNPKCICFDSDSISRKSVYDKLISKNIKVKHVYSELDEISENITTYMEI